MEIVLEKFIEFAQLHGQYTNKGNYKEGNRAHNNLMEVIKQIRTIDQKLRNYSLY